MTKTESYCNRCKDKKPITDFYVSKTTKSGKPVYFSYCKRCVNARDKRNRDKKNAPVKYRIIELLSKLGPMTSKEIYCGLGADYKSVAKICSVLRKQGLVLCVAYKGDMPVYSAPPIKKEQLLEKGVTQADLDYQAYYRLPRHIRRKMPPPVIDSVATAEMQRRGFAFGNDYAVRTNGNGPW